MQLHYKRHPAIYKNEVLFVFEDDLWKIVLGEKEAHKLVADIGEITHPFYSPNGEYIAFTVKNSGHSDVYMVDRNGQNLKRLTFLGAATTTIGWNQIGSKVFFRSNALQPFQNRFEIYSVSLKGAEPEKLSYGNCRHISYSPKGSILLGRNTANESFRWKRYKGGRCGNLLLDKKGNGVFEKILNLDGNIGSPFFLNETIFFTSDHEGVAKLYSYDFGTNKLLSFTADSEYYLRNPNSDGERIVFQQKGEIYLLSPASGETKKISIQIQAPRKNVLRVTNVQDCLEDYSCDASCDKIAMIARGSIVISGLSEAISIHKSDKKRYRIAQWLHDNKSLITVASSKNEDVIELHSNEKIEIIETNHLGKIVSLKISPKEFKIVISNHKNELHIIDLNTRKSKLISTNKFERFEQFEFSPDGKWLVYSYVNSNSRKLIYHSSPLFLYNISDLSIHQITPEGFKDMNPVFSPCGKFIYFLSYRDYNPVYQENYFGLDFPLGCRPYALVLNSKTPSPFLNPSDSAFYPDIDILGIQDRLVAFPVDEKRYMKIFALDNGVLFSHLPLKGELDGFQENLKLEYFSFEKLNTKEIPTSDLNDFKISSDKTTLIFRSKNNLITLRDFLSDKTIVTEINLKNIELTYDLKIEWEQMFEETWQLQKENYWTNDKSIDWKKIYEKYAVLLPSIGSRSELSDLIWELLGELSTSHTYEFGGDYPNQKKFTQGFLAADFKYIEKENAYEIIHIYKGDSWKTDCNSPLLKLGNNLSEGDLILSIDETPLSQEIHPNKALEKSANSLVKLEVKHRATNSISLIQVKALASENNVRYREWVENNREKVLKASKGKINYIHIPDMGAKGYSEFFRYFRDVSEKEGLIIDIRYNLGGHISPLLLEKLSAKNTGYRSLRYSAKTIFPPHNIQGSIVVIADEYTGSDGDLFCQNFKQLKLGLLIGKRTWGGVIGTYPRHRLADGTLTTQAELCNWVNEIGYAIENWGVEPDIEVEIMPFDYKNNIDTQLNKALEIISKSYL